MVTISGYYVNGQFRSANKSMPRRNSMGSYSFPSTAKRNVRTFDTLLAVGEKAIWPGAC